MNSILKLLILFFCVTGLSTVLMTVFDIPFGHDNYWKYRGYFFLFFITLFPRLTLLFSSVASGGFLWWIGWLFAPRFLVAFLATITYWHSNKILVLISWMVALGGETSEKSVIINRGSPIRFKKTVIINGEKRNSSAYSNDSYSGTPKYNVDEGGETFEADYTIKKD